MGASEFNPELFEEAPVLVILRGVTEKSLSGVMETVIQSGLRFVEITLNTPNAIDLIKQATSDHGDTVCLGAGTVLTLEDAQLAIDAGARFLVSPTLNDAVASFAREHEVPYFPGALTPSEIEKAWNAGAYMVKVFPASQMGPDYFRLIKGPFQNIRLMAVGGVGPKNIAEYFDAGASALALGGSVFSSRRMEQGDFAAIRGDLEEFLLEVKKFSSKIKNVPSVLH